MSVTSRSFTRAAALAVVLGSLALASPSFAAPIDSTTPPGPPATTRTMDSQGNTVTDMHDKSGHHMHKMSAEDMQQHVEDRIKSLHAKLKITPDEEQAWGDVAQAMRDSEANVGTLVRERHQNSKTLSAVEDLESYQKIAQAHADGLAKVTSTFSTLYNSMPDDQKQLADKVFGGYEGHPDRHHMAPGAAAPAKGE